MLNKSKIHQKLRIAKENKRDEFYTQFIDIERELQHYKNHFKDKIIFCNCDDPRVSNFFSYFKSNFENLGLKKLISSGYKNKENGIFIEYDNLVLGEINKFREDGDFRSVESINFLKESDIVVTNPPFSLFREYIDQLISYDKKFLIIANINSITYKEIFNLIKGNKVWLGVNMGRGISGFIVPEYYDLYGTEVFTDTHNNKIVSTNNCLWLTNLETPNRNKDIVLTKRYYGNENEYPKYDNYNAINVNKTKDIPIDYDGFIGVPITFLHKFNPEQFELVKFRKGDDDKDLSINGKYTYFRIIVRNKKVMINE